LPGGNQPLCVEGCGGGGGPVITLIAPVQLPGSFYEATPYIEIDWCDNNFALVGSSRWIKLDGVTKTSSFTYQSTSGGSCSGSHYKSTTTSVSIALGTHTLSAYICNDELQCTQAAWSIQRLAGPMPSLSLAPHNADILDYGRCASACFAATHAQSTVPYFSLDTPRSVTLVYNGDRVDPRPFIHADVTHGGDGSNLPSYFTLKVQKAGGSLITFLNGETELHFAAAAGIAQRIGGQFNATSNGMGSTGVYAVTVVVGAVYAAGTVETSAASRVIVVNEGSSPIAQGWTVAGIQRLYPNQLGSGALVTEGDGSAIYFSWNGSTFTTPAGEFSRLTAIQGGGWRRSYPDSTVVTFNTLGSMTSVRDRWGSRDSVQYDGSSRPWLLRDPVLAYHAFYYDANGLDRIATSVGLTTEVTVQANRTLTAVTDRDGLGTTFGYDASARLSSVTDRRGIEVAQIAYAGTSNRLDSIVGPSVTVFGGGSQRPRTKFTPWQLLGVPTSTTSGAPFPVVRADTAYARVTDPGGHVIRFTANAIGQPTRTVSPVGDTVTVVYTSAFQVDSVIDPHGVNAGFDYDGNGNVIRAQAGGITSRAHYHATWVTQADSTWGDGQPIQRISVGANGRVDSVRTVGLTGKLSFTYDSYGRPATATDRMVHLIRRSWYSALLANRSKDSLPTGAVITYAYDGYGRPTTTQVTGQPVRTTSYDSLGRAVALADGVNPNPTRSFFGAATLDSVMDPAGQTYRFGYNAAGWITSRTDPAGLSVTMQYDVDGLLRRSVNRRTQAVDLTYDAAHRPLVRSGAGITDTTFYATSGDSVRLGNAVASVTTYTANTRRLADSVPTVFRLPGGGTRTLVRRYWHRALDGRLDSVATYDRTGSVPFVTRGYAYHPTRFTLDSLRLGTAGWTRFDYNNDVTPYGVHFPDLDSIYQLQLQGHDVAAVNSLVADDSLLNDSLGRLVRFRTDDGRQRVFAYDSLGRLRRTQFQTSAPGCLWYFDYGWLCNATLDSILTYAYDGAGNRTAVVRDTVYTWVNTQFWYTTGNRITRAIGPGFNPEWSCTYRTDADGNVRMRDCGTSTDSLLWRADGQLDSLRHNGTWIGYRYDPAGRLARRDSAGTYRYFLWDGDDLVAEFDSTNGLRKVAEYSYYGTDNLHAVILGTTPYYAHTDVVGNIRGYTRSGVRYGTYRYDEFGRRLPGDSSAFATLERPHWKGALWMEPGADLYYMRNRWYEPLTGRFLSEDPLGLPGGINAYVFGGSDPVDRSDPFGSRWVLRSCIRYPDGSVSCGWDWVDDTYDVRNDDHCSDVPEGQYLTCMNDLGSVRDSGFEGGDDHPPPPPGSPLVQQQESCDEELRQLFASVALDFVTAHLASQARAAGELAEFYRANSRSARDAWTALVEFAAYRATRDGSLARSMVREEAWKALMFNFSLVNSRWSPLELAAMGADAFGYPGTSFLKGYEWLRCELAGH